MQYINCILSAYTAATKCNSLLFYCLIGTSFLMKKKIINKWKEKKNATIDEFRSTRKTENENNKMTFQTYKMNKKRKEKRRTFRKIIAFVVSSVTHTHTHCIFIAHWPI